VNFIGKYSLSVRFCFNPQTSLVEFFFRSIEQTRPKSVLFQKKRKAIKKVDDPGGPVSPAARKKKQKTVPSPEEKEEKKD
jgi:hypothetical protein